MKIVLFENQNVKLEVNMKDKTVWLSANQWLNYFKTIRKYINNVLEEELKREEVVANFASITKRLAKNIYIQQ